MQAEPYQQQSLHHVHPHGNGGDHHHAGMPPMNLIAGKITSMLIDVVVTLGIPDLLAGGAVKTSDDIAKMCNAHPDRVYRTMRALTNDKIFVEHEGKRFSLAEAGEFFRKDHPKSIASMARWLCGPTHTKAWLHVLDSVVTGEVAAEKAFGMDPFQYFGQHPKDLEIFQNAMTDLSRAGVPPIIAAYHDEWSKFKTICDIGGGHGLMLGEILKAAGQESIGVLYELPEVTAQAPALMRKLGVDESRVRYESGDFFKAVPKGVDLYVMKAIIHDHDDDRCIKILRNCAAGLNPGGKVLIMDMVVPGPNVPHMSKLIDTEMFAMVTGRERTEAEFAALLEKAGLKMTRAIPTHGMCHIVESVRDGDART
jgi:predicted O-methyltransferase YrrM